ncbi:hypothetical protein EDD18DRAFT_1105684 [Armillaria luteobubalina]|uniref:Uncharacterized protein n=1 Tax=Armillaria luteobubalina TaxID=153913 RepID=A0AA39Q5E5_9AGAR|nr:hypothetical protein EDD18DRAFT_1105684 [Armillaria luteobubalina]
MYSLSLCHIIDVSEPKDPALRVMQPALMEEHLITLGCISSVCAYCPIIAPGFTPDTFDMPRSLVEAFKFESYGAFVSLAHVPHTMVSVEKKSVHYAGSNAVCMTTGLAYMELATWTLAFGLPGSVETTCINDRGLLFPMQVEDPNGRGNNNSKYMSGQLSPAKGHWGLPTKAPSAPNFLFMMVEPVLAIISCFDQVTSLS